MSRNGPAEAIADSTTTESKPQSAKQVASQFIHLLVRCVRVGFPRPS